MSLPPSKRSTPRKPRYWLGRVALATDRQLEKCVAERGDGEDEDDGADGHASPGNDDDAHGEAEQASNFGPAAGAALGRFPTMEPGAFTVNLPAKALRRLNSSCSDSLSSS
jgi:hypothetical protein